MMKRDQYYSNNNYYNRKKQVMKQKITLAIMLTVCVIAFSMFFNSILSDAHGNQSEDPASRTYYTSIQVESGDTLSSIAKEYRTENYKSTTDYIEKIKEMNQLSSDEIHEGQYLMVAYQDTEAK